MKTQLSKPARSKTRYTEEYKKEALELWRNSGRSAAKVGAEPGIRPALLYRALSGRTGSKHLTLAVAPSNDTGLRFHRACGQA